ncbi:DUF4270 family protein [Wenyingzhuangia aestuarii]|uniref:DUF4270 family protein n=1 Tax=Wenyingzhuangia aestuarii TaxID=1647582 RepID=UPI001439FCAB|nr:DUF4270 family protein [Wenyingzhuangia aestuarii]NJB82246.1 hypothetical protein [Wenyingzhuangia aestuarii]
MRFLFVWILGVLFLTSCSSDELSNYTVGSNFVESDIRVREIDTFSINTGTYLLDSLETSSTSRILLGSVTDDFLGKLTSQSYFELQNGVFTIDSEAVFDSIGFVLSYDGYYFADTTKTQTYTIHRVLETVEPVEEDAFYNTSSLSYANESLGSLTFVPKISQDSIYIPMDNTLGAEIFDKIQDNEINNVDDFIQYFKGVTIVPDTSLDSHILGFNVVTSANVANNSCMRLYFSVPQGGGDAVISYYMDFYISSIDKQFNAIKTDLSSAEINGFTNVETVISSEDSNQLFYSQAGTGISARIEVPHLRQLKYIAETGTVLDAELVFYPHKSSANIEFFPEVLYVYIVDHKNRIIGTLTDADGALANAILNGGYNEFENTTYYSVDLTGFVTQMINADEALNYALMVQFANLSDNVDKIILENKNNVKLTVKYLNY